MSKVFECNKRLGIRIPVLQYHEWMEYNMQQQSAILHEWEQIRGNIPNRIQELERLINKLQQQLNQEENFPKACSINYEISEAASCITDLHIWFRSQQEIVQKTHQ